MQDELKESVSKMSPKDQEIVNKLWENRRKAQTRWLAKQNSPEYRARQADKEAIRRARQAEKAKIKREGKLKELKEQGRTKSSYEFESAGLENMVAQSRKNKANSHKRAKPKASKGTKGRSPTANEARMAEKLAALPCICCTLLKEQGLIPETIDLEGDTQYNEVSLHHCDGRTKPLAHYKQLPLCGCHHQVAIPAHLRDHMFYKYLVPIHADGIWGGKAPFKALFGTEQQLLEECYKRIGEHAFFCAELS